tara:strand:- start:376 stop:576 length:201 start_codon:yes stop_codon:yes gene_type:complete
MKPKNAKLKDYSTYFEHYKKLIERKQQVYIQDAGLIDKLDNYFKSVDNNIDIIPNGSGAILQLSKN